MTDTAPSNIEERWTEATDPVAQPLIDDLAREYRTRYGAEGSAAEMSRYPAELFTPEYGGGFLILLVDGVLAAGGAYTRSDPDTAEIKRVWTSREFRRKGHSRRVMAALEQRARDSGYTAVELTTGWRQPEAVALYLSLGYRALFDVEGDLRRIGYLSFAKSLVPAPTP